MGAALSVCTEVRICDEQDLAEVLACVYQQFEVADECNEANERVARGYPEHAYGLASRMCTQPYRKP
jgi:hypothetical protein